MDIAILASGSGTNANAICEYFKGNEDINIKFIITDNMKAKVKDVASEHRVNYMYLKEARGLNKALEMVDFVVLAGWLSLIPKNIVEMFPNKIVNIHPALLPKHGGKGMYGHNVHKAVKDNNDTHTGITVHYVNENYDEGNIIEQVKCRVFKKDTPEMIEQKVRKLELKNYSRILEKIIKN